MAIKYFKLFDYMNRKGIKKKDLLKSEVNPDGITKPTIAKLTKNEIVNIDTIDKLCKMLSCQPGDLMEYQEDDN